MEEKILKDSGARRTFESGGVRDVQVGKGRCDLLPLDVVAGLFNPQEGEESEIEAVVFTNVNNYIQTGEDSYIYNAITRFSEIAFGDVYTALLETSKHYEAGALKYAERNWQLGLPQSCYIDSGIRHFIKWCRGDDDEPHDRAFIWNMLGAVWTKQHRPDLSAYPVDEKFI